MNFLYLTKCLRPITHKLTNCIVSRSYAKPAVGVKGLGKSKVGKAAPIVEAIDIPVERDTHRLVEYVCGSNYHEEGEDVKIKPDSEYPDWLWNLRTGEPPTLDELDPNTIEYWKLVAKMKHKEFIRLRGLKKRKLF